MVEQERISTGGATLSVNVSITALREAVESARKGPDRLRSSMLELALAMANAALEPAPIGLPEGEATRSLDAWARSVAEVLDAIAAPLAGLGASAEGRPSPLGADGLVAAAARLASLSGKASEALGRSADDLRARGRELLDRVATLGALDRSLRMEKGQLSEDLRRREDVEEELGVVMKERAEVVRQVETLQERLRFATGSAELLFRLNTEVAGQEADWNSSGAVAEEGEGIATASALEPAAAAA